MFWLKGALLFWGRKTPKTDVTNEFTENKQGWLQLRQVKTGANGKRQKWDNFSKCAFLDV